MLEPLRMLVLGLVTGFAFGFLLQKGRVAKYQTVLGQLLLRDWTVVKVMATAVVVGSIGVYALVLSGHARLDVWPLQPSAQIVGALLFGVGLAVFGYCPGTGLAGSAEGSRDAMVGVAGMLTGAAVFVALFRPFAIVGNVLGNQGKRTIPLVLGVSPWFIIVPLAVLVAVALFLIERHERSRPVPVAARPRRA